VEKVLTDALHLGCNQWLEIPLGKWFAQMPPWGWHYHWETNSLWEANPNEWIWHGGIQQHTHQLGFHAQGKINHPPMRQLERATIV